MKKNLYLKNDVNYKKAFSLIEMLIAIGIIGFISVFALSLSKSVPTFRLDSYTQKYCELIDNAVTSAAAATRKESVKQVSLAEMVSHLKGTISEDGLTITMMDGTEITKDGDSFTASFPDSIGNNTYLMSNDNGLDCVTGATPTPVVPDDDQDEPIIDDANNFAQ